MRECAASCSASARTAGNLGESARTGRDGKYVAYRDPAKGVRSPTEPSRQKVSVTSSAVQAPAE